MVYLVPIFLINLSAIVFCPVSSPIINSSYRKFLCSKVKRAFCRLGIAHLFLLKRGTKVELETWGSLEFSCWDSFGIWWNLNKISIICFYTVHIICHILISDVNLWFPGSMWSSRSFKLAKTVYILVTHRINLYLTLVLFFFYLKHLWIYQYILQMVLKQQFQIEIPDCCCSQISMSHGRTGYFWWYFLPCLL